MGPRIKIEHHLNALAGFGRGRGSQNGPRAASGPDFRGVVLGARRPGCRFGGAGLYSGDVHRLGQEP